jgi:hypothetical protein
MSVYFLLNILVNKTVEHEKPDTSLISLKYLIKYL